jgi:hypothetical protein
MEGIVHRTMELTNIPHHLFYKNKPITSLSPKIHNLPPNTTRHKSTGTSPPTTNNPQKTKPASMFHRTSMSRLINTPQNIKSKNINTNHHKPTNHQIRIPTQQRIHTSLHRQSIIPNPSKK